jgi:hypothetical protein
MGKGDFDTALGGVIGPMFVTICVCILGLICAVLGGVLLGVGLGQNATGMVIAGGVLLGAMLLFFIGAALALRRCLKS